MEFTWYGVSRGNNCPPRRIDNYSFIYVSCGKGIFHIHNNTYRLQSGDMFILHPEKIHSYYSDEYEPWELIWFGITGKYLPSIINKTAVLKKPVLKGISHPLVHKGMKEIVSVLEKKEENYFAALSKFFALLGYVSHNSKESGNTTAQPGRSIKDAARFMELNYVYNIDMSTLASHFCYTRTYFSALFKKFTGMTPVEYLTKVRLEKACFLLEDSALSIGEVSNSVGYRDPFYFSKLFRRYYGLSPRQYREKK